MSAVLFRSRAAKAGRLAAAVAVVGAAAALVSTPAQAAGTSDVYVIHGIPGATVDVYVNGDLTLDDFTPTTVAGPLELAEGSYDLKVVAGDAANGDAEAIVEANDVAVPAGASISVVAHLSEAGAPTLTPFVNDTATVEAGQARLIVRHTAAAPAVDVLADGAAAFEGLTNPNEAKADLPAGSIEAAVALAGTTEPVIGPVPVDLAEGTATIVYAIGSAEDGTLDVVAQVLEGLHSNPDGVPAGSGGAADTTVPMNLLLLGGLGAALVAAGAVRVARSRQG